MLVARLLASVQDHLVCHDAYIFLRKARGIALQWLDELLAKLEAAEIDSQILDYQERVCEMAAICRSTYDVSPQHIGPLLSTDDDFSTLIRCSINLYDNQPPDLKKSSSTLQALICRDRRLVHKTLPLMLTRLRLRPEFLDQAVLQLWTKYCRGAAGWVHPSTLNSEWVSTTTGGANRQTVHLNLLEGQLLINGKPLGRLPREYISHPTYTRLFGQVCCCSSNG